MNWLCAREVRILSSVGNVEDVEMTRNRRTPLASTPKPEMILIYNQTMHWLKWSAQGGTESRPASTEAISTKAILFSAWCWLTPLYIGIMYQELVQDTSKVLTLTHKDDLDRLNNAQEVVPASMVQLHLPEFLECQNTCFYCSSCSTSVFKQAKNSAKETRRA